MSNQQLQKEATSNGRSLARELEVTLAARPASASPETAETRKRRAFELLSAITARQPARIADHKHRTALAQQCLAAVDALDNAGCSA